MKKYLRRYNIHLLNGNEKEKNFKLERGFIK